MYKYKILVIDDDNAILAQAEELLFEKYAVSIASSCEQAVAFFESGNRADLILLDIMMPNIDGYETLEKIRQIKKCDNIPVIFLTGAKDPDFELKALKLGAKDYITKPFNDAVFLARIELRLVTEYALELEKLAEVSKELTDIELEILRYMSKGYSNEEISNTLHYSYGYVKQLVSKIFEKLDIANRKEIKKFIK